MARVLRQCRRRPERSGSISASQSGSTPLQLADENDVLSLFAKFVVFYPVRVGQDMNRESTAENISELCASSMSRASGGDQTLPSPALTRMLLP